MALQRRRLWNKWMWLRPSGPLCWGAESSSHPALLCIPRATGSVKCRAMGHWLQAASETPDDVHCLRQATDFSWKSLKNWLVKKTKKQKNQKPNQQKTQTNSSWNLWILNLSPCKHCQWLLTFWECLCSALCPGPLFGCGVSFPLQCYVHSLLHLLM